MTTRAKDVIFKPKTPLAANATNSEPLTLQEAANPQWCQTMDYEYCALLTNQTWSLVDVPDDKPLIGCLWIFKTKTHLDGSIARYKARLVAKGYS